MPSLVRKNAPINPRIHFLVFAVLHAADGNWYSVDISCADLLDIYGVDFSTATEYKDKNLFTFTWGGSPDNFCVDYAAFFYGPQGETTGIESIYNANHKSQISNLRPSMTCKAAGWRRLHARASTSSMAGR